ncbi:MAG: SpoIID/LytB domain-containing protein [Clostridia bacterium]|nr:SpoIID/LytB domain-containing protein [Clostridia bacterium]
MKKIIALLLIFTYILISAAIPASASSQIRIGLLWGADAKNAEVGSKSGVNITLGNSWIACLPYSSVTVSSYASYYTVIEKSGFGSIEECQTYVKNVSTDCVPFYHAGSFHAAKAWYTDYESAEAKLSEVHELLNPEAYILSPTYNSLCICVNDNPVLITSSGTMKIEAKDSTLTLNGSGHRGILEFSGNSGYVSVISILSMEEYLYGVVSCEIGSGAPLEAKKAQAVCARTYAMANMGKHSPEGFDLCATQDCQVYGGMATENATTIQAVNETAHQLLRHNGQLVNAYYSASCGGKTADAISVWKIDRNYLKSATDDGCESYTWEENLDYNKLSHSLAKIGKGVGKLKDINIAERSSDGSVTKLEFIGEYGTSVIEKEAVRTFLGVKSQYFDFTDEEHEIVIPVNSNEEEKKYPYISHKYSVEEMIINGLLMNCTELVLKETVPSKTKIKGYGYGHRVGMCQLGAINHAKNGWDYHKILAHYYNGSKVS